MKFGIKLKKKKKNEYVPGCIEVYRRKCRFVIMQNVFQNTVQKKMYDSVSRRTLIRQEWWGVSQYHRHVPSSVERLSSRNTPNDVE